MKLNAQYAQEHFDEFLSAVESGEPVEVTREGGNSVRLKLIPFPPVAEAAAIDEWVPPKFGLARGLIHLAPDWDSPETNAEIAATFEESDIHTLDQSR